MFFNFYMCLCDRRDPLKHGTQGRGLSCLVLRIVLYFPEALNRLPLTFHCPEFITGKRNVGFYNMRPIVMHSLE